MIGPRRDVILHRADCNLYGNEVVLPRVAGPEVGADTLRRAASLATTSPSQASKASDGTLDSRVTNIVPVLW